MRIVAVQNMALSVEDAITIVLRLSAKRRSDPHNPKNKEKTDNVLPVTTLSVYRGMPRKGDRLSRRSSLQIEQIRQMKLQGWHLEIVVEMRQVLLVPFH
jgi:hypothetical protein